MSEKETGGPAFPFEYVNQTSRYQNSFAGENMIAPNGGEQYAGMTLRDYFAAKALQGMLADTNMQAPVNEFAARAYAIADAMLEARK